MEIVYVLAIIAFFAVIMGILLRLNDKEHRHDDDRCRMRMEIHGVNNRHIEERVGLLYEHLGLQVKTIPAVPEHREVVKFEPLEESMLKTACVGPSIRMVGTFTNSDKTIPKSNKKRG